MSDIAFVDAHIHLWDFGRLRYPWLEPPFDDAGPNGSVEAIAQNYLVDDYLADAQRWNVVGAVHVDAGADPRQALDESEWLETVADDVGLPTATVAFVALDAPDAEDRLAEQAANGRVCGIRQILNWHPDPSRTYGDRDLTTDERWRAGYSLLARYGLSFDLQCYPGQMPGLASLLAAHPETQVIVNHMGMPVLSDVDGLEEWRSGMHALAAVPHVSVKLSGLGFIWRDWTYERVAPLLLETIETFGIDRCMFASDAPTDKLFAPFDRTMETFASLTQEFSDGERSSLFGRNANRVYRLGLSL